MTSTKSWISLPKVELHDHLDGGVRFRTLVDLARTQGVLLPTEDPDELKKRLVPRLGGTLEDYLKTFGWTVAVLQTEEALRRAAREAVEDWAADGIVYGEIRFAPELHCQSGLGLPLIVEAVVKGLQEGKAETGVETGLILCAMRQNTRSLEIARLVKNYESAGVVAFDLAGPEASFPPGLHLPAFDFLAENSLNATCHAGEAAGADFVGQAVTLGRSRRIGHGVRLVEDLPFQGLPGTGSLARRILDQRILLEVCLTSNMQTGIAKDLKDHPFGRLFRCGFALSLCTDNRMVSDTTLSREIALAADAFGLTRSDLEKIQVQALRSAFAPWETRARLLAQHFPHAVA